MRLTIRCYCIGYCLRTYWFVAITGFITGFILLLFLFHSSTFFDHLNSGFLKESGMPYLTGLQSPSTHIHYIVRFKRGTYIRLHIGLLLRTSLLQAATKSVYPQS